MNIIYKFTSNKTKRFYIGSKTECQVINQVIVDRRGKNYYSSSSNEDYWLDLKQNGMQLQVLEEVPDRDKLLGRESYHQRQHNAVDNSECYNRAYADNFRGYITPEKSKSVINKFGETLVEVASRASAVSRKDSKAIQFGFLNYGDMYKKTLQIRESGKSLTYIDELYNTNCFFKRVLRGKNLKDFKDEVDLVKVAETMQDGATFLKTCEVLNYKDWVVREKFGSDLSLVLDKRQRVATINGFKTENELNNYIMREYINGKGANETVKNLKGTSNATVSRIINSICREHLNLSDFR